MSQIKTTMNGWDAVSGSQAECYVTIGNQKYNFMQLINFEAKIEKTKADIPILGRTGKGHKTTSWNGTFKGTAHYNQTVLRKLFNNYKNQAWDTYFEIQVRNLDNTGISNASGNNIHEQWIILKDCNLSVGILAKFDVKADFLEEEIEGTFEDFDINTAFTELTGMKM